MTLAIGWLHDGGDTVETWLHQAGDWHGGPLTPAAPDVGAPTAALAVLDT